MKVFKIDNLSNISKGVFEKHMVRKSRTQKDEFAKYLQENLPDLENFNIEKYYGNKNIVIGDINNSKYVFTAHYDTPATMWIIPNFLTPKNFLVFILYQLVITALMIGIGSVFGYLGTLIGLHFIVGFDLGLILCIIQMMFGFPNKNNYNDNTSGVITLIELYLSMTAEERKKCVFVFFDNEEKGMLGSAAYNKKHKALMEEREVINFDCVGEGDHILLIHQKVSDDTMSVISRSCDLENKHIVVSNASKTIYPSDQTNFKHSIGVAAFNKNKIFGYYIGNIHTKFDKNFDEVNIFLLVEHFKKLVINE